MMDEQEPRSPLTSDKIELNEVPITAEEATRLRRYASQGNWKMPVSQYERNLYAARGLRPPGEGSDSITSSVAGVFQRHPNDVLDIDDVLEDLRTGGMDIARSQVRNAINYGVRLGKLRIVRRGRFALQEAQIRPRERQTISTRDQLAQEAALMSGYAD
jgi:hypothetical protein